MRFSSLLSQLSAVTPATPRDLAGDPDLRGAEALDRAADGQLSFLEPGNSLAAALEASAAAAVLLPPDPELQRQASARGIAWVALADPRLAFAEALDQLHPRRLPAPGLHPTAVVDPSARLGDAVHLGPFVVVGADAVVGDRCILHASAVLYDDVVLAEGCEIHSHAVLHPGTRLGAGCVVHSGAVVGSEGFGFVPTAAGWRKMPQTGQV
ncbi:MAG: LpxD N-terminal domain-containing protein, partial [Cyanobium sp.]